MWRLRWDRGGKCGGVMRELWRQQRRGAGGVGVRSCSGGRTGEVVIGVWRSSPMMRTVAKKLQAVGYG